MSLDKTTALFIDCDNISPDFLDDIINVLPQYGKSIIKHAYADWSKPNSQSWLTRLNVYGIKPIQVLSSNGVKNASDMQIIIDIMKTINNNKINVIILVSSDSDFTSIAHEVVSTGLDMVGMGETKTNISFRKACSVFIELPIKKHLDKHNELKIVKVLTNAILAIKDNDDFALLAQLGTYLKNQSADYIPSNYGGNSWKDILKQYPQYFKLFPHPTKKSTLCVSIQG